MCKVYATECSCVYSGMGGCRVSCRLCRCEICISLVYVYVCMYVCVCMYGDVVVKRGNRVV